MFAFHQHIITPFRLAVKEVAWHQNDKELRLLNRTSTNNFEMWNWTPRLFEIVTPAKMLDVVLNDMFVHTLEPFCLLIGTCWHFNCCPKPEMSNSILWGPHQVALKDQALSVRVRSTSYPYKLLPHLTLRCQFNIYYTLERKFQDHLTT